MVPPSSVKIPRVPTYLMCDHCSFAYGTITLSRQAFQPVPLLQQSSATPRSLAATKGISIDFFSCRYLDVSVPCVRFTWTIHSSMDDGNRLPVPDGFPHSDIPGLTVVRHLPRTYRSPPRPSSPLAAKASTTHAYSLDHITPDSQLPRLQDNPEPNVTSIIVLTINTQSQRSAALHVKQNKLANKHTHVNHALVQISVANLIQPLITKSRTGGQLISNYELLKNSAKAPSGSRYTDRKTTVPRE